MKSKTRIVIGSFALLIAGLVAVSLVMAGNSRAQEPDAPKEVEKVETVREIISDGELPEGWVPFPFEAALHDMVEDGRLTQQDLDQIMADLSERTDAVTYESSRSGDGGTEDVEVKVEIKIEDDGSSMREPIEQTLDQAVADGLLTAEEAAEILSKVDEADQ